MVLTILFVPETAYVRLNPNALVPVDGNHLKGSSQESQHNVQKDSSSEKATDTKETVSETYDELNQGEKCSGTEKPKTFLQLMKPWPTCRFSDERFFKIALRPFTLVFSPVVAWGTLVYGTTNAWCASAFHINRALLGEI